MSASFFSRERQSSLELGVEESLKVVDENLRKVMEARERILKTSRDCISSCSKAIVLIHTGNLADAKLEIRRAEKILTSLRKEAREGGLSRYLVSPEAEFVEASAVEAVSQGNRFPQAKELGVSGEAYVMGLLDTVGELKRLLLDAIMNSEIEKARSYFGMMEGLYSLLSPFAVYDNVTSGVRRKIDVARMLTDDVRGVIAEEARRSKLLSSMQNLRASVDRKAPARRARR